MTTRPWWRRVRPWRSYLALVVVGLVAGGAFTMMSATTDLPDDCDDVLAESDAEALLRTQDDVPAESERGDEMTTCTWRTEGDEDDGTRRASTVTVSVLAHPRFRADPSVEQVSTYTDMGTRTTPSGLGDDAVGVAAVRGGVAHAEVGAHDGAWSVRVVYTSDDGDRAMTAYLAELTARKVLLGGAGW